MRTPTGPNLEYATSGGVEKKYGERYVFDFKHGAGSATAHLIQHEMEIGPSHETTQISIKSRVMADSGRPAKSAEYFAVVRRRSLLVVNKLLKEAKLGVGRADFAVCVFPVIQQLNETLDEIQDAPEEGNTRESLRRIRNTFTNGGWRNYQSAGAFALIESVLSELILANRVMADYSDELIGRLWKQGLAPVTPLLVGDDDEKEDLPD